MDEQLAHYAAKLAYEIDAWDLKAAIDGNEHITVIDARSADAFQHEHIPGAVNIPHRTMAPETTGQIDKGSLVVTYCNGIGCNASTKGAIKMVELGFRVKELMGGLDWWKRDGHPTAGMVADGGTGANCGCGT